MKSMMKLPLTVKQQEILEASLRVIERDGLKRFTMKNIALEVGVTDAALYKHFTDKGQILGAIATLFKTSTLDALETINGDSRLSGLQKLERFVKERGRQFEENRALTVTLFSDELFRGEGNVSSINSDMMENHGKLLQKIVVDGQADGSIRADLPPPHLVMLLTGPVRLMVTGWKSNSTGLALSDRLNSFWATYEKLVSSETH